MAQTYNVRSADGAQVSDLPPQESLADALHMARVYARGEREPWVVAETSKVHHHMAKEWIVFPSGIASEYHRW